MLRLKDTVAEQPGSITDSRFSDECRMASISRFSVLLPLIVVAVTSVVLGAVVRFDFVAWDDDLHVYANPRFLPVTWEHMVAFWQAPYQQLYIPLTYTVWAVIAGVTQRLTDGEIIAEPFHYLNLILHLGNVLIVYRLGRFVLGKLETYPPTVTAAASAMGALMFGIHPLQVEAVAWISGLKDILWGGWALIAIWQYLRYRETSQGWRRSVHYGLATLAFACALLSKPAAVVVPLIAVLLDVVGMGHSWPQAIRSLWGWLLLAGLCGVWTKTGQPDSLLNDIPTWSSRILIAGDALAFYLRKLVWPVALGPDYGRMPMTVLRDHWSLLAIPVPLGVGAILWHNRKKCPGLWLAAAIFMVALLPVLGLVPFAFQAYSTVADRYAYVALLGPALGVTWVMSQARRRWPAWVIGILALCLLAGGSMAQVSTWQNTVSLFTHGLQVNPASSLAHNNLGLTLAEQGRLDDAISHFRSALAVKSNLPEAHYNLAKALTLKQAFAEAIPHYSLALELHPNWAEAHNNLGIALEYSGEFADALLHYAQALLARPGWAEAHYNMGNVLSKQGLRKEAAMSYRMALRQRPSWPMPTISLAELLLAQPSPSKDALDEAVRLAESACKTTDYQDAMALFTLSRAYQATGRQQAARTLALQALRKARVAGYKALESDILSHFPAISQRESSHVQP